LDYAPGPVGAPKIGKIKKGGEKVTTKLPWATAAVIIVAAVAAWAIWGQAPAVPPTGAATVTMGSSNAVFTAAIPTYSGIENIYIVKSGQNYAANFSGLGTDNVLGTITATTGSVNIPYETNFAIVVAVKGATENMAYVVKENMYVYVNITGSFTASENTNTTAKRTVFLSSLPTYIRVNHYCDNGGNYYRMPAGGTISLNPVNYYCYK
jgi:hypothetical protein